MIDKKTQNILHKISSDVYRKYKDKATYKETDINGKIRERVDGKVAAKIEREIDKEVRSAIARGTIKKAKPDSFYNYVDRKTRK